MQELIDSFKNSETLHHAYFVVGDEGAKKLLFAFLEEQVGIKFSGNPDFWHGRFDAFTIDDARALATAQEAKSFDETGDSKKIFIVESHSITEQAQNALLKVFEEPTVGTHFFIIMPQDTLLPTLRSRMQIVYHNSANSEKSKILKMKPADRLMLVKSIIEEISDEDKTKQDAIALVNNIEAELYTTGVEKYARELQACEHARASLYNNGAPVKMILENVMLSV